MLTVESHCAKVPGTAGLWSATVLPSRRSLLAQAYVGFSLCLLAVGDSGAPSTQPGRLIVRADRWLQLAKAEGPGLGRAPLPRVPELPAPCRKEPKATPCRPLTQAQQCWLSRRSGCCWAALPSLPGQRVPQDQESRERLLLADTSILPTLGTRVISPAVGQ